VGLSYLSLAISVITLTMILTVLALKMAINVYQIQQFDDADEITSVGYNHDSEGLNPSMLDEDKIELEVRSDRP